MKLSTHSFPLLVILLAALLLAGCGTATTPNTDVAPAEDASAPVDPAAEGATYQPLDPETCAELQTAVSDTLGVEVARSENAVPYQDMISGQVGGSCQLFAGGTGDDFPNFLTVAGNLGDLFRSEGWTEETQYLADSPTGTVMGFRQEDALAIMRVEWQPSADASCPADQPISECAEGLEPEQMIYRIVIDLVEEAI